MSTQRPDIIVFKDKKFVIIDIGKNQTLVSKEKILSNLENDYFYSSSCVRGYTAEFKINKNNQLLYKLDNKKKYSISTFTGNMLITYKAFITDFLISFLEGEEAYELHFTNGKLDAYFDLSDIIIKYADVPIEEKENSKNELVYIYDDVTYRWKEPSLIEE